VSSLLLVTANKKDGSTSYARQLFGAWPCKGTGTHVSPVLQATEIRGPSLWINKTSIKTPTSKAVKLFHGVEIRALRSELRDVLPVMRVASVIKGNPFTMGLHHFAMFHCRVASGIFGNTPKRQDRHSPGAPVFPAVLKASSQRECLCL
jgi:hypothetical protein